uniref:Pleckstrin homology and RUN domain containing M2 n=1 Tax=Homo sapiens TaxID=9606 RepID=A0ABJ7H322_HUMAN
MEPGEVKDRILENISLSVKKLQSYFAACEDEIPAIRNHDKVLQRLCEHLDHALLYGPCLAVPGPQRELLGELPAVVPGEPGPAA